MFNPLQNMNFSGAPLFWKQRLKDKAKRVRYRDLHSYGDIEMYGTMEVQLNE